MKTPSFLELKTLVEWLGEELNGSQLQEVYTTEEGVVLTFYRFHQLPHPQYLVFDLDKPFPFLGLFNEHPWGRRKKNKPLGLFLNAHGKNLLVQNIELVEKWGRVVQFQLGKDGVQSELEFRLIPKQTNLIVTAFGQRHKDKVISWYPVQEMIEHANIDSDEEVRAIPFLMQQWLKRRGLNAKTTATGLPAGGAATSLSPYEKWKKQKEKDLIKKTNALLAIQKQIDQFQIEPWSEVGEQLKNEGFKNLRPEWSVYVKFDQSVSQNIQNCFDKAKSAKVKIIGAEARKKVVVAEIEKLNDLSEKLFEAEMKRMADKKNKTPVRTLEGRYRKLSLESSNLVCYMGKSAKDNIDLLRQSKSWDYWLHLKDYPSAHAILHRQKGQSVSDPDLIKCATWLIKEGLSEKVSQHGGKFDVVIAECRHVRPLKGDKLGRVTYNEAREMLIAL